MDLSNKHGDQQPEDFAKSKKGLTRQMRCGSKLRAMGGNQFGIVFPHLNRSIFGYIVLTHSIFSLA